MWIFTIICFLLFIATLVSTYYIIRRASVTKKYFYLKQFFIQLLIFVSSYYLVVLLALGGSGHHVDTQIEHALGEFCGYTLIITLFINVIAMMLAIIKSIKNKKNMSLFDKLFDAVAWIKIFLSPFIVGAIGGFICWIYSDNYLFKILSVLIILTGTLVGIYFAERVRKKMSTQEFVSRINATPDIDTTETINKK